MPRCRITVIRKMYFPELVEVYGSATASECVHGDENIGPCEYFQEGDSIILDNIDEFTFMRKMPNGFCTYAWQAIGNFALQALREGRFWKSWMKDERQMVVCCLDAMRPVVFLMEIFGDDEEIPPVEIPDFEAIKAAKRIC